MKKYEYRTIKVHADDGAQGTLNKLAEAGWRLKKANRILNQTMFIILERRVRNADNHTQQKGR